MMKEKYKNKFTSNDKWNGREEMEALPAHIVNIIINMAFYQYLLINTLLVHN